jgi:hypothetical protein
MILKMKNKDEKYFAIFDIVILLIKYPKIRYPEKRKYAKNLFGNSPLHEYRFNGIDLQKTVRISHPNNRYKTVGLSNLRIIIPIKGTTR